MLTGAGNSLSFDADTGAAWTDAISFTAGETKEFVVMLDWTRDNVAKDFSLTAWGTSGVTKSVEVKNKNASIVTDHMPQYTDDKSGIDPPEPVPEPDNDDNDGDDDSTPNPNENCVDIDNGAKDPYGDGCAEYNTNPQWCSLDFADFHPTDLCCVCGGGEEQADDGDDGDEQDGDDEVIPDEDEEEDDVIPPIPDEDEEDEQDEDGTGTCVDIDNGAKDPYGDGCAEYNTSPEWCALDFTDFHPTDLCCICGGGEQQDGGDDEDETIPDEDEDEDDVIPPIPDEDEDEDDVIPPTPIPDEDEDENDDGTAFPTESELFTMFDTNGDGCLSLEEFQALFTQYCLTCPFPNAEAMFNLYDTNNDNKLCADEFAAVYEFMTQDEGEDDATPTPGPTPETDFDAWVYSQQIPETDYFCFAEIHNEWHNGYNFFAGHDCEIYDLEITVMARVTDWESHVQDVSSDAQELGCEDIGTFDRACRYFLTPNNNKFGIRFDEDADVDLYYETKWTNCIDEEPVE